MKYICITKTVTLATFLNLLATAAFAINSNFSNNSLSLYNTHLGLRANISPELDSYLYWNDIVGASPNGITAASGVSINPNSHNIYIVGATDKGLYATPNQDGKKSTYFIRKYEMSNGIITNKNCSESLDISTCYKQYLPPELDNNAFEAKAVEASTEFEYIVGDKTAIINDHVTKQQIKQVSYFISKYSSNLQFLNYNEAISLKKGKQIKAFGVAKDNKEDLVYIVGCTNVQMYLSKEPQTGLFDYYVTALDGNDLNPKWVRQMGVTNGFACARSVQVESLTGVAYITGYITDVTGKTSAFVEGYNKDGEVVESRENLGGQGDTRAYGIAVDQARELLYVVGSTNEKLGDDPITSTQAMFVAQYSLKPVLQRKWVKTFGAANNPLGKTAALSVTVADNEYVYITGNTDSPLFTDSPKSVQHGKTDTFVLVLDDLGAPSNYVQIGGKNKRGGSGTTDGRSIAVDSGKYVFVTGFTDAGFLGESVKGLLDYFLTEISW